MDIETLKTEAAEATDAAIAAYEETLRRLRAFKEADHPLDKIDPLIGAAMDSGHPFAALEQISDDYKATTKERGK